MQQGSGSRSLAVDCDLLDCLLVSLTVYIWMLPEPGLVWIMPGLLLNMSMRSGGSSQPFSSTACCHWQPSIPIQEPLVPIQRPSIVVPWAQAAGDCRDYLCREMSLLGSHRIVLKLGELGGSFLRGLSISSSPSPGQLMTMASPFCSV